jgi:anti-sigma B factor antagonist
MIFSTQDEDGATVLRIGGELDAVSVTEIRPVIDSLVEKQPPRVVVDLADLRLIDSSGVGSIVSLYRRVRAQGGTLTVRGLRHQPLEIFRLLRLDRVLTGAMP